MPISEILAHMIALQVRSSAPNIVPHAPPTHITLPGYRRGHTGVIAAMLCL